MEYLAPEHQDLAKKGLEDLRGKLCTPRENVLEGLKSKPEDFCFARTFRRAQEYTNRNLPTASLIWKYLLQKSENADQKIAVLKELFHAKIATGPWNEALETAQNLFNETTKFFTASRKTTTVDSLADPIVAGQHLFDACINMGSIRRLRKEIQAAEELYHKAREVAASIHDIDKETLAKVHLAICLLDRGELKKATESYFMPLMAQKSSLSNYTRAIYLQSYGNGCRSAANWGKAKEYLREALVLAKELKDDGLVSSCCGDLGNVFRSEGRYRDAERFHMCHYNIALKRGDTHGLAIACGNIGFLKFYNPDEFDDSLVYQFIEYSLAEQVGDFARMGISFNKIGKLYTTLGYYEEAVELFQIAIAQAQKAGNVAGEGMAWGNLGTVYRALEQYEDAIVSHIKYRDNAKRRMDTGGLAIMQHQLAMDYYLNGNLPEAESSILGAFQTLEGIRAQIGDEDESKISNFEKNQSEAYNLLQVVLVAQQKYKEAFVLADASRGRTLSDIVRRRLFGSISTESGTKLLNEEFITESFNRLKEVGQKLATSLVLYSVVKEFDQTGAVLTWVYAWVLQLNGKLHFCKTRLKESVCTKVELNDEFVISLSRSMSLHSQSGGVTEILRGEKLLNVPKDSGRAQLPTSQNNEVFETLERLEEMFSSDWECDCDKMKEKGTDETPARLKIDVRVKFKDEEDEQEQENKHFNKTSEVEHQSAHSLKAKPVTQADRDPSAVLEMCRDNDISHYPVTCSVIDERQAEATPIKDIGTIDIAQSKAVEVSGLQEASNLSGDHISCQGNSPPQASSNENLGSDNSLLANSTENTTEMNISTYHNCFKEKNTDSFSKAGREQSLIFVDSSNAPIQSNSVSAYSLVASPGSLCAVDSTVEELESPLKSSKVIECQKTKTCEFIGDLVINSESPSTSSYSGLKTPGSDCMTQDDDLRISSEVSTFSLESVSHTTMKEAMQVGTHPALEIVSPPSMSHLVEMGNITVSPDPRQSAYHTGKRVDEDPSSTTNGASQDSISVVLNSCGTCDPGAQSEETETTEASTITVENDKYGEEEDLQGHSESINDFSEDTPLNLIGDAVTNHSLLNEACANEDAIEEDKNNFDALAPNLDYAGNTPVPDDHQDDPELAPWQPMLNQIHKILIEPITQFLPRKGECPRITFIPQDFLLKVPFAALQEAPGCRYFIEDFVISTSPAIHFLELACASRRRPEQSSSQFTVLAVGNPEMPFDDLPQLPSSQREVRMISEIVNSAGSELFIGEQANKKDVVAAMPKHTILHFATHAVIDDSESHGDFTMKGLVVLAKSGRDCNGLLTAAEVRSMELNAELVVLSCCDTGLGKVTGDGVLGLSRAFLAAGAECVIVTLWKIDDRSTSDLMASFYREYKICRDAAVSLQKAMKYLQAEEDTRSPKHWAAFSIVGSSA